MEIIWLGHACFALESGGCRVVLDPYLMDDYPPLRTHGNLVLCSHGHFDHNYVKGVRITDGPSPCPFAVEKVATFHDDAQGAKRGNNTIHILRAEGLKVAHFGDLGHYPTEEQMEKLRGCDAVLIPVGGFFTIDARMAKRIVDELRPRVIVPMHYRHGALGLRKVGTLDEFLSLWPESDVHRLDGNRFTLTAEEPRGVIVPKFMG